MDLASLSLYILAMSAVTVMPGPTMLLALNKGAHGGKRIAANDIAGAALSDLILIVAVGCGLGAPLLASEQFFYRGEDGRGLSAVFGLWTLERSGQHHPDLTPSVTPEQQAKRQSAKPGQIPAPGTLFRPMGSYIIIQMAAPHSLLRFEGCHILTNSGLSRQPAWTGTVSPHPESTRSQDETYLFSGS